MKVKDLIRELQKCDSESDVVVGGEPIYFIEELPGYYDGSFQRLIQNEEKSPYYNIEGMFFTSNGNKVRLNVMSVQDILWNVESEEDIDKVKFEFDTNLSSHSVDRYNVKVKAAKAELRTYFNEKDKK